jgi:SET domain-containing protein
MKKALLKNLNDDIYCRIKPSKKHGVGVFAIRDIPKDTYPFKLTGSQCIKQKIINIPEEEVKKLHPEVRKLVDDFYHKEDSVYGIPYKGLNANDISFYMNTSKKPNVGFEYNKGCTMVVFKTLRKIKKGEELLINYDEF